MVEIILVHIHYSSWLQMHNGNINLRNLREALGGKWNTLFCFVFCVFVFCKHKLFLWCLSLKKKSIVFICGGSLIQIILHNILTYIFVLFFHFYLFIHLLFFLFVSFVVFVLFVVVNPLHAAGTISAGTISCPMSLSTYCWIWSQAA